MGITSLPIRLCSTLHSSCRCDHDGGRAKLVGLVELHQPCHVRTGVLRSRVQLDSLDLPNGPERQQLPSALAPGVHQTIL